MGMDASKKTGGFLLLFVKQNLSDLGLQLWIILAIELSDKDKIKRKNYKSN